MASGVSVIVPQVLSNDEYTSIPEDIRKKIEDFLNHQSEERIVSQALLESSKVNFEQTVTNLENELTKSRQECQSLKTKFEATLQELEESKIKVKDLQNEVSELKETVNRLEVDTSNFRHQRDLAVDERDELLSAVERRNTEVERLQEDMRMLSEQLQTAVAAKCEALVKAEEVESQRMALDFKEKRIEQERERLNNEIQNLTEDLNRHSNELMNLRRDNTTRQITLETQLSQKTEELRIAQQTVEDLTTGNANLHKKMETSLQKMMAQRENETKLQEYYENEVESQKKLAEVYKGNMEEAEAKAAELTKTVGELQEAMFEASTVFRDAKAENKTMAEEYDKSLAEREECIENLKTELSCANDLIKATKHEKLETAIEELSPSAANISRLIKSGMTLTQLYMQFANVSEQLLMEKEENRKLNEYMNTIIHEIEAKAPVLKKQREDYESLLESVQTLAGCNDTALAECNELRQQLTESNRLKEHHEREAQRLKEERVDLGRQVCFLLKEIENMRCNYTSDADECEKTSMDITTSEQVISKRLVTFSDIQELQANNQKLIALVRELSKKAEVDEGEEDVQSVEELKAIIKTKDEWIEERKELEVRSQRMLDALLRQVDTYRQLYHKSITGSTEEHSGTNEDTSCTASEPQPVTSTPKGFTKSPDTKDKQIQELNLKLKNAEKAFKELRDEADTYRIERQTNERLLTEQLESMRKELRDLRTSSSKLLSQVEYNDERFKIMQANASTYKTQIAALESKNKNYNSTIIKHEQTIMHLKDEAMNAQRRLARAEVGLENARQECLLLRESEARLQKECEVYTREQQGQSMLLANLDSIRASLERSEAEGKARLETRVDEALRECNALRRRLQEEQDRFREFSANLERQTETAKQRLEEEKKLGARTKEEMQSLKEQLAKAKNDTEEISKKLKDISSTPAQKTANEAEVLSKRVKELQMKLTRAESDLQSLRDQLTAEKQHSKQFCEISESMERRLSEVINEYNVYKENTGKKLKEGELEEEDLQRRISFLENELSTLTTGSNQSSAQLNVHLTKTREQLRVAQEELDRTRHDLTTARLDLASLSGSVQAAEEKYAHEVVLHSADLQALTTLKEELATLSSEVSQLRVGKEQAEQALDVGRKGWEERELFIKAELKETQQRITDLDAQNSVLHDQIEALSSQLAIVHAQASQPVTDSSSDSLRNRSLNTSFNEDEVKSSEQLMQIIKYLRREKDIAVSKFDVLRTENLRLKSQLENMKAQLDEAKKSLSVEKEKSDVSVVTTSKHAELMRKVETLNAITDSNRILRGERDGLQLQVKELSARVESLEQELGSLREQNREVTSRVDAVNAENIALRGEAGRLRQRVNFLIERSNKTSPEDWRRLQQEREGLTRQLTAEKEAHQRMQDEARTLRQDRARLEEQVNALSRQHQQQLEDNRRQSEELNQLQQRLIRVNQELNENKTLLNKRNEEFTKTSEEIRTKETLFNDIRNKEMQIRKIAKKYKTQYEELTKKVEEDKKMLEEREKAIAEAATGPTEISPEAQEQLREEGRKKAELHIQELESRHLAQLKELSEQVSSSQEASETLRKENDALATAAAEKEKRAKNVLTTARSKIQTLTTAKNMVDEQNAKLQNRLEALEHSKVDEESVRLTALKSQYEGRILRLEKENADLRAEKQHETESLNQRLAQLQRQVDKIQVSKPSTSSGPVEKVTTDPPTANIKPMAGPTSSGSKQQPTQQSITVAPWPGRGETPFASIRPMSMQSRTVAVLLPTSQSSSSSNQTPSQVIPVLVSPQQQLVHTTGTSSGPEILISSPTSSHTDYMPATSSASGPIRQVLVQPTITTVSPSSREEPPLSAAESTQDMEAESRDADEQQLPVASQQQQQQAVALVLPRVEQQTSTTQTSQVVEQSVVVASSQAASSSNTVTTTQAGLKRPREAESDNCDEEPKLAPQGKRTRMAVSGVQEMFPAVTSESGLDVEYQVPTSSQRDQEDEIIVVDSEDEDEEGIPDDGDLPGYDEGDGPDIDEENGPDQDNNEVEIIEDSNEVPNQSGSSVGVMVDSNAGQASNSSAAVPVASSELHPPQQQHSEATSSGTGIQGISTVGTSQTAHSFGRGRSIPPLSRQLLGYEDPGDDSIVPSTPTLFVPRRSDGFGEAVSSPQVPQGRFTFSDTNPPTARAGVAQVASEGMDDTRMDLTQLEESGTGRSVPTTPLQVSPQELDEQGDPRDSAVEHSIEQEDILELADEGGDGVSSEGEKPQTIEEMEEGREAEATEQSAVSSNTRRATRGGTARRSGRNSFRGRGRGGMRPTPIIWNEPGSSMGSSSPRGRACLMPGMRGSPDAMRANFTRGGQRARRMRSKVKGNFSSIYQMRF